MTVYSFLFLDPVSLQERLWSTVRIWNTASFRVLDKIGFERDHVTADDRGEIVWLTRTLPQAESTGEGS